MRGPLFTLVMTYASRVLIRRARLEQLPRPGDPEAAAQTRSSALTIESGANRLDALFCEPAEPCEPVCVLICHGIGETIDRWLSVQELLAREGVSSMVFNYSGYGRSTGRIHASQLELDAVSAFASLQALRPRARVSLLGFSLGSAIATAVVPRVKPHRLVLCSAFTSFRKAAANFGMPRALTRLLPDIWDSEHSLRTVSIPMLLVHGAEDGLFPVRMAHELAAAYPSPCEPVIVPGLAHNAPIDTPDRAYWSRVARFLRGEEVSTLRHARPWTNTPKA